MGKKPKRSYIMWTFPNWKLYFYKTWMGLVIPEMFTKKRVDRSEIKVKITIEEKK